MFSEKWFPWKFLVRRLARAQGFLDPIVVFSHLQRFSKPSEVWVPTELLRSGAILQARGLMNSQAIQHNLETGFGLIGSSANLIHWIRRLFPARLVSRISI